MPATLRVDVSLTPSAIPSDLHDTVVVVIDVLRATTTIVYALANGARSIIPCEEPADALAVRDRLGRDRVVLGGERDSVRIPGFDLDNSPLSYTRERIEGKTVAFTTTNGTRALQRAQQGSPRAIICGAFVNLSAVAERAARMNPSRVLLACAGSEGAIALEDLLLGGAIAVRLRDIVAGTELSDSAKAAALAYEGASTALSAHVASADHAQALIRAGFTADIQLASRLDEHTIVPILEGGEISQTR